MGKSSAAAVTVSCPNHYQVLVNSLWRFFARQHKTDWEFKIGDRSICAHGLIAEIFLHGDDDDSVPSIASALVENNTDHSYHRLGQTSLDHLLEFMYNGQVTLPRDRLDQLLSIAEELKFKLLLEAIARCKKVLAIEYPDSVVKPRKTSSRPENEVMSVSSTSSREKRVVHVVKTSKTKDESLDCCGDNVESELSEDWNVGSKELENSCEGDSVASSGQLTNDPDYAAPTAVVKKNLDTGILRTSVRKCKKKGTSAPKQKCMVADADCECPKCTEQRSVTCEQCPLTFASTRQRNVHITKAHLRDGLHRCSDCDYSSSRRHQLEAHRRIHTGEKPFTCEVCGKQFSRVGNFSRHKMIHSDARNYMCHECGRSFKSYDAMTQHLLRHRGIVRRHVPSAGKSSVCRPGSKPRSLSCVMCSYVASRSSDMTRHCRTEHAVPTSNLQRPFGCPSCASSFKSFQQFVNHWRVHTGERPYACHFCDKKFSQEIHLKVHCLIHTGQKPHKCDVCGRDFAQLQNMKAHRRIHFGEQVRRVRKRRSGSPLL